MLEEARAARARYLKAAEDDARQAGLPSAFTPQRYLRSHGRGGRLALRASLRPERRLHLRAG